MEEQLLRQIFAAANVRLDDQHTAILSRQLEQVKAQTFDVLYSKLKAKFFIPVNNEIDPGVEHMVYQLWDEVGFAKLISNYADDLPAVDAFVKEFSTPFVDVGDSYAWSVRDLKRAAYANVPLDTKKAIAAKNMIERKFDQIAAFGSAERGIPGFVNHPNVPALAVPNGDWLNPATTEDEIIEDLFAMEQQVISQSKENHEADTIILPIKHYGKIATQPFGQNKDKTILKYFLDNAQTVKSVERWGVLDEAGPGGTPQAICYVRSPECLELQIPTEFETLPPERRNLTFYIPCLGRIGGTAFFRPLSAVYGQGI